MPPLIRPLSAFPPAPRRRSYQSADRNDIQTDIPEYLVTVSREPKPFSAGGNLANGKSSEYLSSLSLASEDIAVQTRSIVERAAAPAEDDLIDSGAGAIKYSSTVTVRASSTAGSSPSSKYTTNTAKETGSEETSILAEAVATTNLSWWQLFALIFGCVLAVTVGGWAWWRHRRKKRKDLEKKKADAIEEDRRRVQSRKERELMQLTRAAVGGRGGAREGRGNGREGKAYSDEDDESEDSWSESDDSISDGGTIRASKTRRRMARGGRGRRRERDRGRYGHRRSRRSGGERRDDSELESGSETDWSDEPRYHDRSGRYGRRGREYLDRPDRDGHRDRRRYKDYHDSPYYSRKGYRRPPAPPSHRRDHAAETPLTGPSTRSMSSPTPTSTGKRRKRDTFRDSVFSSYNSMKNAAVRLKYVEAKVKLKKQLEEEDRMENRRREKVREANREIEEYNRLQHERAMREREKNRSLLVPPAPRQQTRKSSSDSNYSDVSGLPYEKPFRSKTSPRNKWSPTNNHRQLTPPKSAMKTPTRPGLGQRQDTSNSLDGQISHLLGGGGGGGKNGNNTPPRGESPQQDGLNKNQSQSPSRPPRAALKNDGPRGGGQSGEKKGWFANTFQSDWLSHPAHSPSHQVSMTSLPKQYQQDSPPLRSSVYLPVTLPKERPIIPRGGLAPAPPPRARTSGESMGDDRSGHDLGYTQSHDESQRPLNLGLKMMVGAGAGVNGGGGSGSKWTDRLRQKRT
ncbi:hypothetical protein I316_06115 [Kwoniella heveanensis BCC8398]|uniref:Uncharacterized protein n=1 Tax=Kwoniella heveanensis BCC8398 TaxID=1296120 RepID=A0A1B9GMI2_9TREE|nr:hypothetical protein I316_06115 [Kwoniella heveanensis BCC8398]